MTHLIFTIVVNSVLLVLSILAMNYHDYHYAPKPTYWQKIAGGLTASLALFIAILVVWAAFKTLYT